MNNSTLFRSSPSSTYTCRILGDLQVELRVTANPYGLPLDALFAMAARMNKKRGFLFVSKLLGKHIPVEPHTPLLAGAALSLLLARELGLAGAAAQRGAAELEPAAEASGSAGAGEAANRSVRAEAGVKADHAEPGGKASPADGPQLLAQLLEATVAGLVDPAQAQRAYGAIIASGLVPAEPVKFIGFAETATALGHSMYQAFAGGCTYIHTTRELLPERTSLLNFEEEHSHATTHRCYAADPGVLAGTEPVVLVDDEMTTGRTALNIIRDIHRQYPRPTYYVAALLDWRTAGDERQFAELEAELGVTIRPLSLIKGELGVTGNPFTGNGGPLTAAEMAGAADLAERAGAGKEAERGAAPASAGIDGGRSEERARASVGGRPAGAQRSELRMLRLAHPFASVAAVSLDGTGATHAAPYLACTGRFGLDAGSHANTDRFAAYAADALRPYRSGGPALCMGTGEFMYIPMRIAAGMGAGVRYQSTTRSPIYPHDRDGYAVRSGFTYPSPEDPGVSHFMYNIAPGQYEELFVFMEREYPEHRLAPMVQVLERLGIPRVYVVVFADGQQKREGADNE